MTELEQLTNAINRLAGILELGPKVTRWFYMYVGQEEERSTLWYHRPNGSNVPCDFDALVGYIEMIDFEVRTHKQQENLKLKLLVNADRPYHIQCGAYTHFAKCVYLAACGATPDQLKQPIYIRPYMSDQNHIFCELTVAGEKLRSENVPDWGDANNPNTAAWDELRLAAQLRVEQTIEARGIHSRLRDREPEALPSSFRRLKNAKTALGLENDRVKQAIAVANPEAGKLQDIKDAIAALSVDETGTVILNLLWWWGIGYKDEPDLKPFYNQTFEKIGHPGEKQAIEEFIKAVIGTPAAAPAHDDPIPY